MKSISFILLVTLLYTLSISPCLETDADCCNDDLVETIVQTNDDSANMACSVFCIEQCCQNQWFFFDNSPMKNLISVDIHVSDTHELFKETSHFSIWDPPRRLS